jgi:hypothetical protein
MDVLSVVQMILDKKFVSHRLWPVMQLVQTAKIAQVTKKAVYYASQMLKELEKSVLLHLLVVPVVSEMINAQDLPKMAVQFVCQIIPVQEVFVPSLQPVE